VPHKQPCLVHAGCVREGFPPSSPPPGFWRGFFYRNATALLMPVGKPGSDYGSLSRSANSTMVLR
jgi:hypothetical protein